MTSIDGTGWPKAELDRYAAIRMPTSTMRCPTPRALLIAVMAQHDRNLVAASQQTGPK
ncbi:hypothetical protein X742_33025 [Mesorhizobium sp. LNHC232B00]|nr:hypothetical protein X742_33025 [Mesorhizobium sp. LNHC232B00]